MWNSPDMASPGPDGVIAVSDTGPGGGDPSGWLGAAAMVALNESAATVVAHALERLREHALEHGRGESAVDTAIDVGELDELAHEIVRALCDVFVGARRTDPGDHVRLSDRAAGVVAIGVPAPIVRHAIHVTCAVVVERLVNVAEGRPPGSTLTDVRRAFAAVADFEFELVERFDDAVRGVDDDRGRDQRLREAFLRRVIEGPVHDPAATRRRGETLKLDLTPPFGLMLLVEPLGTAEDPEAEAFEERVLRCRRRPDERLAPAVFVEPDPTSPQIAVFVSPAHEGARAASVDEALIDACEAENLLAIRTVVPGLVELSAAYHEMRGTTPILERCSRHLGPVPTLDALLPYRVVARLPDGWAEALLRSEVGPLMADGRAAHRLTTWKLLVRERIADAEAARRLHVARGTLRKRRASIESLLGHPLASDPFRAQLASYIHDLWEPELPPPGDPWWSEAESESGDG